jgi:hypothetical protein
MAVAFPLRGSSDVPLRKTLEGMFGYHTKFTLFLALNVFLGNYGAMWLEI